MQSCRRLCTSHRQHLPHLSHTSFPIPPPQSERYKTNVKQELSKSTKKSKTYNSGYSLVVTHLTTNPPVRCLNRAERTGSLVFNVLWSYVQTMFNLTVYNLGLKKYCSSPAQIDRCSGRSVQVRQCRFFMHSPITETQVWHSPGKLCADFLGVVWK